MAKFRVAGNTEMWITAADGTLYNMSSYIDTMSTPPTPQRAALDVTTFGDTAETFIAGIETSKEITIEGPYDDTATSGPDVVFALLVGTLSVYTLYPVGTASGARRYSGTLLFTNYEPSGGVTERVSYSASAQLSGAVTVGTAA